MSSPTGAEQAVGEERLAAALKPAQRRVLSEVAALESGELTRGDYERIGCVSRSQAAYDLAELVKLGLLERIGSGRATYYRLAHAGGGRKRKWTEERIRAELAEFCADRREWPRARAFKRAGRGDLYLAASRHGGIERWAAELGYRDAAPGTADAPGAPASRAPAARVGAVALAVVVVVAAATSVVLRRASDDPARTEARAITSGSPARSPDRAAVLAEQGQERRSGRVDVRLAAARGSSWLVVRRGSATGTVLYAGTVRPGHALRFRARRLWVRLGAPANLRGRLNGRRVDLPARRSIVVITPRGLRVVRTFAPPRPPKTTEETHVELVSHSSSNRTGAVSGGASPPPAPAAPPPAPPPAAAPPAPPPPAASPPPPVSPPPRPQPTRPAPDQRPPSAPSPDPPPGG
jgi:Domain of unknown function (DUF4115)